MSRLSERAGKNRLAIIAGIGAAVGAAWIVFGNYGVELVGESIVEADVVEVIAGQPGEGAHGGGIGIVMVELPDGGRARVFVPAAKAVTGRRVTLKVNHYSDGSREAFAIDPDEDNSAGQATQP